MSLKSYTKAGRNINKLHKEISASNTVAGFTGLFANETHFSVLGTSITDEPALDLLVTNHTPIETPESITPRQAKQALFLNGITAAMVEAAVNQLPSPNKELAMIEWEYSTAFLRSNPLVNQIGAVFGKTPAEIDAIWILGDSL
jgi:hypothetical protein